LPWENAGVREKPATKASTVCQQSTAAHALQNRSRHLGRSWIFSTAIREINLTPSPQRDTVNHGIISRFADDWHISAYQDPGNVIARRVLREYKMKIQIDQNKIKTRLIEQREVLTKQIKEGNRVSSPSEMINPDRNDLAANYTARAKQISLLEQLKNQRAEVDEALARIDDGTYGICENCGNAILPERLAVLNYARLCIECQRLANKAN